MNHHIKLEYLQVTSGVGVRSVASLGLNISGEHFEAAATGNGPVDAAIKAVKQIIKRPDDFERVHYSGHQQG